MRCRELSSDGERPAFYLGHHPAAHQYFRLVAPHAFPKEGSCGHFGRGPLYCQAILHSANCLASFIQSLARVPVALPAGWDMKSTHLHFQRCPFSPPWRTV